MGSKFTRRQFVRTSAAATAAIAAGLGTKKARAERDTSKILSYNPDMEYRRCGRTGLMMSAVCLGWHWKRSRRWYRWPRHSRWWQ